MPSNRKIIYLLNPISGTKDKEVLRALIIRKTNAAQISYQIMPTRKDGDYTSLAAKIKDECITDIVVCGGDGTINQVASAMRQEDVSIGVIPMGSGNGLALAAGIQRDPSKALDIIFKGKSQPVDGFMINNQFSCMLCGLGFDAQVAHDFANQPTRGLATYIKQTVKNFFTANAYPFTIEVNGNSFESEAFFISIANSNQFGNNVTIAPKASISDGLLDIVIVNKMSKLKMVYTLLKQVRLGQVVPAMDADKSNGVHYFQAAKLNIHNPRKAPLHIDGDPAKTSKRFEIEVIPNAFRLLQP